MDKLGKAGIIGVLLTIIVFIVVGVMIVNNAKDQSATNSQEATSLTISFGNAFIFAGVIGILLVIFVALGWLSKNIK